MRWKRWIALLLGLITGGAVLAWQRDLVWNKLIAPLPDLGSKEFEYVRDLVSLAIGALSLLLAGLAIKLGWDNDDMTKRQTSLLEKLEGLEREQANLVAEHQRWQRELAERKPALRVVRHGVRSEEEDDGERHRTDYTLAIFNDGRKGAPSVSWRIMFRQGRYEPGARVLVGHVDAATDDDALDEDGSPMTVITGRYPAPVAPGEYVPLMVLTQSLPAGQRDLAVRQAEFILFSDDERYPPRGVGRTELRGTVVTFTQADIDAARSNVSDTSVHNR